MFEYNSPIISMRRKGTPDDPFVPYEQTLQISNGKVSLTEIPNRQQKVVVTGEDNIWIETGGELNQDNWYQVDYNLGVVHFKSVHNGKSLTFNYLGEGSQYVPVDRVYTKQNEGNVVETLGDIIEKGQNAIVVIDTLDDLIQETNQAIENANDAAVTVNELIDDVNQSSQNANLAAFNANDKANLANQSALNADEATHNTISATQDTIKATQDAENAANEINQILPSVINLENVQSYNTETQYYKNNIVELNGSSFMALQDNIGQLPPILPTKSNAYWSLLAQRGIDGSGAVSSVNGIFPDVGGNVTIPIFSGNYNDLSNKPTIFSGDYNDLSNKPTIPAKTSELENDSDFVTNSEITSLDNKIVNLTENIEDKLNDHLNDFMPHGSGLSQYASNQDVNEVYTDIEFKREDNTLYMKSTASNPDGDGNYQTVTWQFYEEDGSTLALTVTWAITYDANGNVVDKVVSQ